MPRRLAQTKPRQKVGGSFEVLTVGGHRPLESVLAQTRRPYENRPIAKRASDDGRSRVDGANLEGLSPQTDF